MKLIALHARAKRKVFERELPRRGDEGSSRAELGRSPQANQRPPYAAVEENVPGLARAVLLLFVACALVSNATERLPSLSGLNFSPRDGAISQS